jgi:hypothetical protein
MYFPIVMQDPFAFTAEQNTTLKVTFSVSAALACCMLPNLAGS